MVDHRHQQPQDPKAAIAAIADDAWVDIDYTAGGHAQVAETSYQGGGPLKQSTVAPSGWWCAAPASPTPPNKPCFRTGATTVSSPTATDLDTVEADRFHRQHAIVELVIRELKDGGAEHIPSGHYPANAAWFACAVIAHNLGPLDRSRSANTNPSTTEPYAPASSQSPPSPPTAPADTPSGSRPTGHGNTNSTPSSPTCALCPDPPAKPRPAVRRAAEPTQRHHPATATQAGSTRPTTITDPSIEPPSPPNPPSPAHNVKSVD